MKKVLLLGLILAILLLAFPQGVMADDATVNANIVATTGDFSATYASHVWALAAGPATTTEIVPVVLTITDCNQLWDIIAWDADGTTAGHMTEWDVTLPPPGYVSGGEQLNLPLRIENSAGSYPEIGITQSLAPIIRFGSLNLESAEHRFQQEVQTGELHLPTNSYHIVVTIDATFR